MTSQAKIIENMQKRPMMSLSPVVLTWRSWESVAINVYNIPPGMSTFTLWESFKKEGHIITIDIFDNRGTSRPPGPGRGRIRFKPPPSSDIWSGGSYVVKLRDGSEVPLRLKLELRNNEVFVDSPVRPGVRYPLQLEIPASKLDICVLTGEKTFHVMRTFKDSPQVTLDVRRRELNVIFSAVILDHRNLWNKNINSDYQEFQNVFRLRIEFLQLNKLWETRDTQSKDISFLAILETPALYFRRQKNLDHTFESETTWREFDTWSRQTALVHNPWGQNKSTTNLHRSGHIVDIGRWNVFRITFSAEVVDKGASTLLHEILGDHNVPVVEGSPFKETFQKPKPVWEWINFSSTKHPESPFSMLGDLVDQEYVHLDFPVRYQLEVCISNGWLSEFTMTREFVVKLRELGDADAKRLLEHVATERIHYSEPMKIFNIKVVKGVSDAKIPSYCCFMRTARVTPSTVYYNTPTVDTSNRITRRYNENADHFLRVRFTDEKTLGRINSTIGHTQDEIYTRVKRTLANGITIGDRHYEFLAFGNSQFREHGAYFFAPLPHLSAAHIRAWMGQFSHIKNVAKYAARLGQSFSTTRAFGGCKAEIRQIEDISRNDRVFSDGVGKISNFLVSMISGELDLRTPDGQLPSAFQFRLGGCKGMLTVSPDPGPSEIHIRPSQFKFESQHGSLEIIRSSQLSIATLNRQLILVLSARGISDQVFHKKLNQLLENFDEAMQSDEQATGMLRKYIDHNQMSICLAQMIEAGFRKEPFVNSMLALWRAWHLKFLKEKAKIAIEKGANLLGCIDETGILKGHFHGNKELPQIFIQVSQPEKDWAPKVITGVCIIARNPSLHPGDIRVVCAVDVPELRHLRDVVIFPQTGDQDIPSMCSGGDLDGDDYFVFWDPDLIPPVWDRFYTPMKFTSKKAPDLDHEVTVDDVTSFFVLYMKNDILPKIATAHMAWADSLPEGIRDDKCLRLARLHSDAVDYNKTGGAAVMTRDLDPTRWPHFMEKKFKPANKIYHSRKVLGQLYDAIEKVNFNPHLSTPFDSRVLDCEPKLKDLSEGFMAYARVAKVEYDSAMRRIMAQYDITTEFEVWSSWVLSHNGLCRDYNLHEDLGRISSLLRNGFRKACYDKVGGHGRFDALAPLLVAMYRVTHEDLKKAQVALQEEKNIHYDDDSEYEESPDNLEPSVTKLPLISFPWIFYEHLGKIAQGHFDLNAIEVFLATKSESDNENGNGKVYTQAEFQRLIGNLPEYSGCSREKSEIEKPTTMPDAGSPILNDGNNADDDHETDDADSGIEIQDKEPQGSNGQPHDGGNILLEPSDNEKDIVFEIVEDNTAMNPSALDKLISMMEE